MKDRGSARWRELSAIAVLTVCVGILGCHWRARSEPIVIHWDTAHQRIDGFGASATGYIASLGPQQADMFFSSEKGLGLSLLRIRAIADTKYDDCVCVANAEPYKCVLGDKSQVALGDLQAAQLAAARGVRLVVTPWSPPAEMKTSGKYCSVGSMKEAPGNYVKYADELTDYLSLLRKHGLSVDAVSVQNEPDLENQAYDTCRWTGKQIHDFIPVLSKAITRAGFGRVAIAAPEQSTWAFDLMAESIDDASVAGNIGLVFGHGYLSDNPSGLPSANGLHVWQTEVGDSKPFNGDIADGLRWARSIHNYMTIGANAWMYWSLSCAEKYFNHGNNMCLTDRQGKLAKRAYVLGQFAKFVRPGWRRIGITNTGQLLVTAYRGPDNAFAVVVINCESRAERNQVFELSGNTGLRSTITPWVTSSSESLAARPALSPSTDGSSFTYTIPENSVVTFQGKSE